MQPKKRAPRRRVVMVISDYAGFSFHLECKHVVRCGWSQAPVARVIAIACRECAEGVRDA